MVAGSSFGVLKGSDFDNEKWMNTKGEPQGDPAQKMIFYNVQNRGLAKDPNNVIYALYEGMFIHLFSIYLYIIILHIIN